MDDPDSAHVAKNASCGDSYILYLRVKKDFITDASFSGVGCAISQAAASLLTERVQNKSLKEVQALTEEDVYALLGVPISIGREKCALLLFRALQEAVQQHHA